MYREIRQRTLLVGQPPLCLTSYLRELLRSMSINHRRISLSIASGLLLEIINKISPILILYHAQKSLGLADFGWAQFQLALFEVVQPFVTYGFPNFALAAVAEDKDQSPAVSQGLFSHILVLKVFNALLVSIFFLESHNFGAATAADRYSFDILLVVMAACIFDTFWLCVARHKLATMSLISGVLRIAALLLILTLVESPSDKRLFVFLSLLPNSLICLLTGLYAYKTLSFSRIAWSKLREIMMKATPFALTILVLTLIDRIDIFLIERWFGLETAGIYSGPARVIQSLAMVTTAIALPFYAEILKVKDRDSLYKHVALSLWFLSALIAPIIFGIPFIEGDVIRILFSHLPVAGHYLLSLLSVSMIGSILVSVFGLQILMARSRPWPIIIAGSICLFFIPPTVWALKATWGFKSVAYVIIAGKIIFGLLCMRFAKEFLPKIPWSSFLKPILAGAGMGGFLLLIKVPGLVQNLLWGGLAYLVCLVATNFREFKEILQHPKVKGLLKRL